MKIYEDSMSNHASFIKQLTIQISEKFYNHIENNDRIYKIYEYLIDKCYDVYNVMYKDNEENLPETYANHLQNMFSELYFYILKFSCSLEDINKYDYPIEYQPFIQNFTNGDDLKINIKYAIDGSQSQGNYIGDIIAAGRNKYYTGTYIKSNKVQYDLVKTGRTINIYLSKVLLLLLLVKLHKINTRNLITTAENKNKLNLKLYTKTHKNKNIHTEANKFFVKVLSHELFHAFNDYISNYKYTYTNGFDIKRNPLSKNNRSRANYKYKYNRYVNEKDEINAELLNFIMVVDFYINDTSKIDFNRLVNIIPTEVSNWKLFTNESKKIFIKKLYKLYNDEEYVDNLNYVKNVVNISTDNEKPKLFNWLKDNLKKYIFNYD